jgi:hypothetical protein
MRSEGRGRKVKIVKKGETRSSDIDSKRSGSVRVVTDLMENINLSLP